MVLVFAYKTNDSSTTTNYKQLARQWNSGGFELLLAISHNFSLHTWEFQDKHQHPPFKHVSLQYNNKTTTNHLPAEWKQEDVHRATRQATSLKNLKLHILPLECAASELTRYALPYAHWASGITIDLCSVLNSGLFILFQISQAVHCCTYLPSPSYNYIFYLQMKKKTLKMFRGI